MRLIIFSTLFMLSTYGCRGTIPDVRGLSGNGVKTTLYTMDYTIQAGAFSDVNNASDLTSYLQEKGFDAYYFLHESNLYKVRFGNYSSQEIASDIAEDLRSKDIITEYLIIRPGDYPRLGADKKDTGGLRNDIVFTARRFLGVPYYWGGVTSKTGFDCSGLTMAVYKLNGLNLPRTTKEQWASGMIVESDRLSEGDLVFFSTKRKGEVSHVGIYVGSDRFIHAPGKGKNIQIESLSNEYFQSRYMGARTYLE
ncbi:MAG: C40 family peptidase [Deltaproteobacteria bacterium]|nr:C40 family peptidase [Deltaproteobacteria bacterium]